MQSSYCASYDCLIGRFYKRGKFVKMTKQELVFVLACFLIE